MRYILLAVMSLLAGMNVYAADGYDIKIKFANFRNGEVFLAHYYGKPLPTIYKVDSARVGADGVAHLHTDQKVIGGIYMLIMDNNRKYFEFLLDNGQQLELAADTSKLPVGVTAKNDPQNEQFFKYVSFLSDVSRKHQQLTMQLQAAKTKADSNKLQQQATALSNDVATFRAGYVSKHPKTFLANVFRALESPAVPQDINDDKEAAFKYYKEHYWDNVAFDDERMVYTPLLHNKLDEYFTRLVQPVPDIFILEADQLIDKARASREMFKFVVHWLTNYAQDSDVMGMDAVFVHLVEKYYMRGEAFWLNQGTLQKYIDRARSIAPNVIGNVAPELKMKTIDGKDISLNGLDAKYTLLVFWSPDCGHCRDEIPRIDSVLEAEGLKKKGVKVIGFNIDQETEKWQKLIKEKGLDDWIHVHDPERSTGFRSKYDVYGTPSVYMLDKDKIIRGKKLDHTNVPMVVKIIDQHSKPE